MSKKMDFDIVVVGAGLVGAAFVLAMKDSGLRIALVEAAAPAELPQDDSWDSRIYAISPGNMAFLSRLGILGNLAQERLTPIHQMQVWGDDRRAHLDFDAYEAGAETLGYIVESRQMQVALWQAIESQGEVQLFSPAQCDVLEINEQAATLKLSDGQSLQAKLIVGADGGNSWVRRQAGIKANGHEYSQLGVVANFATEKPHGHVARQWFRQDGILAWLPLPGNRMSMVWSTFQQQAKELLALDERALCERVAEAGGYALGALQLVTPAAGFPLKLQNAADIVKPRLALIGDAAHLVHPLAGQGVNLGFHDAEILAQVLMQRGVRADVGDMLLLRRYERACHADVVAMQTVTDGLQKLFNNDKPWLALLRNLGLDMVNHQGWLKRHLMAHAIS